MGAIVDSMRHQFLLDILLTYLLGRLVPPLQRVCRHRQRFAACLRRHRHAEVTRISRGSTQSIQAIRRPYASAQRLDGHQMDIRWTSDGHQMDIRWTSDGHQMDIIRRSHGDHTAITRRSHGDHTERYTQNHIKQSHRGQHERPKPAPCPRTLTL